MTNREKKIYDGMSRESLQKQYGVTVNKKAKDYIYKLLNTPLVSTALVERGEENISEFFQ